VQGGLWSLITKPLLQACNYAVSIVIARLLLPADFGLVGMAAVFTGFAAVFVDFGMGAAIIHQPELTDEQLDAAFLATLGMGAALTVLFVLLAPVVAAFYHRDQLVGITRVGALAFLLGSIGVVPRALLQRRMEIKKLVLLDVGPNVAAGVLSVILAIGGAGVWALVVPPLVLVSTTSLVPLFACGWKPRWTADLRALRPLMRVSAHLLGFNVINYWSRNVDNMLLGRVSGERELGFYSRAYTLMLLPLTQIGGVFSGIMPALARMQDDKERVKRSFMRVEAVIATVSFPAMVGLAVASAPFVQAVYGPKWVPMAPVLQVLAIVGAMQSVVSPTGWIFLSQGRTDVMARWGLWANLLTIVALAGGAWFGSARAMAVAYLISNVLMFFPGLMVAGRLIGMGVRDIVAMFWRPAACSVLMGAVVMAVRHRLAGVLPIWATLGVLVATGIVAFVLLAVLFRLPALKEIQMVRSARL
jgi:PST family polysaccharide transporter